MNLKKILASTIAAGLAVSSMAVFASADDSYTAGLTFQTNTWNYRDTLDQDEMGIDGNINEEYDEHEFNDVEITADGSYTVSLKGLPAFEGKFNMLKLQTTIPCSTDDDGNVVSDVTVEVTGVKVDGADAAFDASKTGIENNKQKLAVCLLNEYDDGEGGMKENGAIENKPFADIEVTFTVSGMGGSDENNGGDENNDNAGDNNGDGVQTPDNSDGKPGVNTGIEGVAVVAGLAVLATGAVVIAKKRK